MLFRAPAPPCRAPFLLLEHKSDPERATCYQVHGYVDGIWHDHQIRRGRRVVAVPAVFAVVVLHGRRKWRRGRTLADLIDWAWPAPLPSLPIFVLDLTGLTSEQLRNLPILTLAKVTLFCLAFAAKSRDFLGEFRAFVPELRALQADDVDGLASVPRYVARVANVPDADLARFFEFEVGPMAKATLMTTLSQLTKEVRRKARAEGRSEGQAQILLKLLTVQFGALPQGVEQRVRQATNAQRERWAERVLGARTLDEVLQDD